MKADVFFDQILDQVREEGMSYVFGGNADPQTVKNNGVNCDAINGGNNCDAINNLGVCALINQTAQCSLINLKSSECASGG